LAEDHRRARVIAEALASVSWAHIRPERVETNIVIFEPAPRDAFSNVISALRARGVLVNPLEDGRIRMVTHLDLTEEMLERVVETISTLHVH
jgi:threonine aldolase